MTVPFRGTVTMALAPRAANVKNSAKMVRFMTSFLLFGGKGNKKMRNEE